MKILITTGLSAADVGGPAQYGGNLKNAFQEMGYRVSLVSFGFVEKLLPIGLRHIYFFLKILPKVARSEAILTLDTFSVGLPTLLAAFLFRKKLIIRVGGDYLWSAYINRTGGKLTLPEFYERIPALNMKEKIIMGSLKLLSKNAWCLAFNTEWQKNIWEKYYKIGSAAVVKNFIPVKGNGETPKIKNFLWAGRAIPEKNLETLRSAGKYIGERYQDFRLDIATGEDHGKAIERVKSAYAIVSAAFTDICPNFIIEGVSFNKPFIMTRETGLKELYPEGGIFFDPLDQSELERAIEAMLDFRIYNKSVEALRGNSISHSWKDLAEEYLEIWKRN